MKKLFLLLGFFVTLSSSFAQVGINTESPNSNTLLHVSEKENPASADPDTYKGTLITRYTTQQRDANFALGAADNGLTIFNITINCYQVWSWNSASNLGEWVSLCGAKQGLVKFTNCSTIEVIGIYQTDKSLDQQDVKIRVPVNVVQAGSYDYSVVVNGVTFSAMGIFSQTGPQDVILYPVSGTPSSASGTFSGNLTIKPTVDGGAAGKTCPVSVKFLNRANATMYIANIDGTGTGYDSGLTTGCHGRSSGAGVKTGNWLGTSEARNIAGVSNIVILCVDPKSPLSMSNALNIASVVYFNGRSSSNFNTATVSQFKEWYENNRGVFIDQGDEVDETPYAQSVGFYVEAGSSQNITVSASQLSEVLVSPSGYTLPRSTPSTVDKQGANSAYISSKKGVSFGYGASTPQNVLMRADLESYQGAFVLGDKLGYESSANHENLFINIMAWAIHNAPVYQ